MQKRYDRMREDVSSIVHLEHVNVTQPDQRLVFRETAPRRPLVNRKSAQTNTAYLRGRDAFRRIY